MRSGSRDFGGRNFCNYVLFGDIQRTYCVMCHTRNHGSMAIRMGDAWFDATHGCQSGWYMAVRVG